MAYKPGALRVVQSLLLKKKMFFIHQRFDVLTDAFVFHGNSLVV